MGGEVTGTIDEIIRHSITVSSSSFLEKDSAKKSFKLERIKAVFNVGCPRNDLLKIILKKSK